jgi:hypothetical protein
MKETAPPPRPEALKEWVTPELLVEEVKNVTHGGGIPEPLDGAEETGVPDPEYYSS